MEKLNELVEQAKFVADWHGSDWSSALCQNKEGKQAHEIICESRGESVISTGSNSNEASWLCDYLELCSPENILAIAEAFRAQKQRAEAAEAKLADLAKQEPVAYVHPAYLQAGALGFDASVGRLAPAQIPLFTRPAPAADLVPIGRVDRGEVSDNNEYPNARVVCLHDQADWENFPDGTKLFLRPAPAVGMDKPEPYAWLVHAPQGDYVERNPEVVAHLEGTGLTKCKPLYLGL